MQHKGKYIDDNIMQHKSYNQWWQRDDRKNDLAVQEAFNLYEM